MKQRKEKVSNMEDKRIECKDCKKEFIFTVGEQEFYNIKGYKEPLRCKQCRTNKKEKFKDIK